MFNPTNIVPASPAVRFLSEEEKALQIQQNKNIADIQKREAFSAVDFNRQYALAQLSVDTVRAKVDVNNEGYEKRAKHNQERKRVTHRALRDDKGRLVIMTSNPIDGATLDILIDKANFHIKRFVSRDVMKYRKVYRFEWGEKSEYASDMIVCNELTLAVFKQKLIENGIAVLMDEKEHLIRALTFLLSSEELRVREIPRSLGFCRKKNGEWWPFQTDIAKTYTWIAGVVRI